jgi:uncharacterized repeat protein (TIGR03803 family)
MQYLRTHLAILVCTTLLAACRSSSGLPPSAQISFAPPNASQRSGDASSTWQALKHSLAPPRIPVYVSLYSFRNGTDGKYPFEALIEHNGALYGTTDDGGAYGNGTLFRITATGSEERILHSFGNGSDGSIPNVSPIDVNGTLYGMTLKGGVHHNGGTVFTLPAGSESVIHNFSQDSDGKDPSGGLIHVNAMLFGTTEVGSAYNAGTVFSMDVNGKNERVLHSFGNGTDGGYPGPGGGLIEANGTLYGTTLEGGAYGRGIVFAIAISGNNERVLHSFGNGSDGQAPSSKLIEANGTLYGTTEGGGAYTGGTVFSVGANGKHERVLHNFASGADGKEPAAGLIDVNGILYGTTSFGGTYGEGTVMSMSVTGANERVLHSFGSGSDGAYPTAGVINVKGTLYSTTSSGGTNANGTIFALTP